MDELEKAVAAEAGLLLQTLPVDGERLRWRSWFV